MRRNVTRILLAAALLFGGYLLATYTHPAPASSHSMRVVDIDGDGRPDLYGANWRGDRVVRWWRNETKGLTAVKRRREKRRLSVDASLPAT